MSFTQKPDHPHQAAVHLVKALKCCKECSDTQQIDYMQLKELQYRKNLLSEQLKQLRIRGESITGLQAEIQQLQQLIVRLRQQNNQVQQGGLRQVQAIIQQRKKQQNDEVANLLSQIQIQVNLNKEIKFEMQNLMERVRYLNRINNQLIYNFCNY